MFHTLLWCLWRGLLSHLALRSHRVHSRVTGFQSWFSRTKPQTSCSGIPSESCWPSKHKVQGWHTKPEPITVSHFSHPSEMVSARGNLREEGFILVPGFRECSLPWQGWQELLPLRPLAFLTVAFSHCNWTTTQKTQVATCSRRHFKACHQLSHSARESTHP